MNDETVLRDSFGDPIEYGMCMGYIDPKTGEIIVTFKESTILTTKNVNDFL